MGGGPSGWAQRLQTAVVLPVRWLHPPVCAWCEGPQRWCLTWQFHLEQLVLGGQGQQPSGVDGTGCEVKEGQGPHSRALSGCTGSA